MVKIGVLYDPEIVGWDRIPGKDRVVVNGDFSNKHFATAILYWPSNYKNTTQPKDGDKVFVKGIADKLAFPGVVENGQISVLGVKFKLEPNNWIYARR